tara:strand:- start:338 stop:553 length:216 start_codon:yes stop_codon:yes gene_type:complete
MKVGDLVNYQGWKAIIVREEHRCGPFKGEWYCLHFLSTPPDFLAPATDGVYPGFKGWQLELLSNGEPNESR